MARRDEQEIRKPVDVFQYFWRYALARLVGQLGDEPLAAPAYGTRQMQIGRAGAAAGQHERAQRIELGIWPVDLSFEPSHLIIRNGQARAVRTLALAGHGEVGAGVEQI